MDGEYMLLEGLNTMRGNYNTYCDAEERVHTISFSVAQGVLE